MLLDFCGCWPEGGRTVNIAGFFFLLLFMVDSKIFLNHRTECQLFILLVWLHAFLHPGIANVSPTSKATCQQDGVPAIPSAAVESG